ncbi:hypothetical protein N7522_001410 [Penicillium canescens]|nr:hypothetical protein N7522_001410 [Penicillium canescens]
MDAQVLEVSDVARLVTTSKNVNELVTSVLSPTEDIRFTRAHYQLWGLMLLNDAKQQERITSMDLEQTCLLSDFLCHFDPWRIEDPVIRQVLDRTPVAHRRLQQKIRRQRNMYFLERHSQCLPTNEFYTLREGWAVRLVVRSAAGDLHSDDDRKPV